MFEFLVIALLIVMLVLLLVFRSDVQSRLSEMQAKIDQLTAELRHQRDFLTKPVEQKVIHKEKTAPPVIIPEIKPKIFEQKTTEQPKIEIIQVPAKEQTGQQSIPLPVVQKPEKPKKPGFFERNPDLEKFIGENLANKIGIAVLVLGIGYFVKYAIDQDWIGIYGRVFIGILCGGLLLGLAHRMRKSLPAFSSVLVGGGIAVLYLTIAIAFHEYQIFSQTVAFILMVIITGFTILLAISYNRVELAVLAILGGFSSPFMVSTGGGNYVILFIYVLILDIGMLILAYYKKWNLVNIICYAFTLILYGSWLAAEFKNWNNAMVSGALIFSTLFYLIFFAMNIIHNVRENTKFKALEISLLLSNTFFYYTVGMIILSGESGEAYRGLFTAALGVFNFTFAYLLYKNQRVDKNLIFLLIGLVLTFISLAAPIQLDGNYITLFWAAEAVLLLWLSQKSGITLMKYASAAITGLMIISLLMDWSNTYFDLESEFSALPIIFNKAYITGIVSLISIAISIYLIRYEKDLLEHVRPYRIFLTLTGLALLYAVNHIELNYQLQVFFGDDATIVIIVGTYNMLYCLGILTVIPKIIHKDQQKEVAAFIGVVCSLAFLGIIDLKPVSAAIASESTTIFTSKTIIWIAIGGVIILLGFMSVRLIRETNASQKQEP